MVAGSEIPFIFDIFLSDMLMNRISQFRTRLYFLRLLSCLKTEYCMGVLVSIAIAGYLFFALFLPPRLFIKSFV